MSFNPNEVSLGRVLSNNIQYKIPRYQRKYVWTEKQWKELIEDVVNSMEHINEERYHFIGSFIFEQRNKKCMIVDGQQRLTTITLLISALAKCFAMKNQPDLYEGIRQYCILKTNDGSLKMRLINEDATVFSNIVYDYFIDSKRSECLSEFLRKEGVVLNKNNQAFVDCYNYFYNYVLDRVSDLDEEGQLNWLTTFREAVLNLKALEITVDKEQEGYIIFEVLNARGLPLEQHELIKNFIFMYYKDSIGSDLAKEKWNNIVSNVEGQSLSSLKRFISHYITHEFGKVSKKEEYNTIRSNVDKTKTKEFLDDLLFKSKIYGSFIRANNSEYTPTINYVLDFLNTNRNYQFRPILLSLFEAMEKGLISKEKVEKYLANIKNFLSIFVVVCKEKTNAIEKCIYEYSFKLHKDFSKETMDEFINILFDKINKDKFLSSFSQLTFSNNKKHTNIKRNARKECKFILQEYEIYLSKIDDSRLTKFTVEHIMQDSKDLDEVCLIGNMIPLVKRLNNKLKDASVNEKISEYKKSPFVSVKEFVDDYEKTHKWTKEDIKRRTEYMAKTFLKNIWIKRV